MSNEDHNNFTTPVVFLMGPTGAGKTKLAIDLADRLPVEIISVDSALVYRGLDIGTAKPSPVVRYRIPHHLIDICDPTERYSAGRFCRDAMDHIGAIVARGALPLLVGGTGLYFRALEKGIASLPRADSILRQTLTKDLHSRGVADLHRRLLIVDPEAARRIHPNDGQRLVRALEVHALTGRPISRIWFSEAPTAIPHPVIKLVIAPSDRGLLHQRLAARFSVMLERGVVNEVQYLKRRGALSIGSSALKAVGYRAVWAYLEGKYPREEMLERAVIAPRQLAKRQLTWLRREDDSIWFDSEMPSLGENVLQLLRKHPVLKDMGYSLG